jgi:hypothetical protein
VPNPRTIKQVTTTFRVLQEKTDLIISSRNITYMLDMGIDRGFPVQPRGKACTFSYQRLGTSIEHYVRKKEAQ